MLSKYAATVTYNPKFGLGRTQRLRKCWSARKGKGAHSHGKLRIIFRDRKTTGRLDLESVETAIRAAMHQASHDHTALDCRLRTHSPCSLFASRHPRVSPKLFTLRHLIGPARTMAATRLIEPFFDEDAYNQALVEGSFALVFGEDGTAV
jgi:hypothetical protein